MCTLFLGNKLSIPIHVYSIDQRIAWILTSCGIVNQFFGSVYFEYILDHKGMVRKLFDSIWKDFHFFTFKQYFFS